MSFGKNTYGAETYGKEEFYCLSCHEKVDDKAQIIEMFGNNVKFWQGNYCKTCFDRVSSFFSKAPIFYVPKGRKK